MRELEKIFEHKLKYRTMVRIQYYKDFIGSLCWLREIGCTVTHPIFDVDVALEEAIELVKSFEAILERAEKDNIYTTDEQIMKE